jgi:putative GTP pyrophosphokinase
MSKKILEEYDERVELLKDFESCLRGLIDTLLKRKGVKPQSISSRIKSRGSLTEKLNRPNKNYSALDEITDVCGIRIITYFREDVDAVAKLIEKEFLIDKQNSIDKRTYEDPDRFGYQSMHYVVSLSRQRCRLSEYSRFRGIKAEIQIRTVIQHAWAEIEHDFGYKSASSIPRPVKRKFYRLAAMLEGADEEFSIIKASIVKYEVALPRSIADQPDSVAIDGSSIRVFMASILPAEKTLLEELGLRQVPVAEHDSPGYVEYFQWLGVRSIDELSSVYDKNIDCVRKVMSSRLAGCEDEEIGEGITLLYLAYVIMGIGGDRGKIIRFLEAFNFGEVEESHSAFADTIIKLVGGRRS